MPDRQPFKLILTEDEASLAIIHKAIGGPTPIDLKRHIIDCGKQLVEADICDLLSSGKLQGNFSIFVQQAKSAKDINASLREQGFPECILFLPRENWLQTAPDAICNVRYRGNPDRETFNL